MARKKISKVKRIQDYLSSNPEARNREVVEALATHSVTAADVSNAKSQMKKKQSAPVAEATSAGSKRRPASTSRKSTSQQNFATQKNSSSQISVDELELTAGYIKAVGGLNQAQQLLQMVQQIQAM